MADDPTQTGVTATKLRLITDLDGNETTFLARIPCTARACYELFADLDRLPEWLPLFQRVEVVEAGPNDRPREVTFEVTGLRYNVHFAFRERERSMHWVSDPAAPFWLRGAASFKPLSEHTTLMRYLIEIDPALAPEHRACMAAQTPFAVTTRFRDFAEKEVPPEWPEGSALHPPVYGRIPTPR